MKLKRIDSGISRGRRIAMIMFAAVMGCGGGGARAQRSWPARPIRLVVNFPPGGVGDQIARVLGPQLAQALGQTVVIENKSGGNGNIGAADVARAPADGHTLLLSPSGVIAVNGLLYSKLPFDPMNDLLPVASQLVVNSFLVVNPKLPVNTMQEFLAHLRANPGKLNYGTPGSGSSSHLAAELLKREAGVDATHVPYKGAAPALTDLLGGQIDFMFEPGLALPHVRSGRLRLIAVASPRRDPAFPTVPTVSESIGRDFDAGTLFGVLAPAGTPREIIARLDTEIARAMQTTEMQQRVAALGADSRYLGQAEYAATLRSIHDKMGRLVRERGLSAE
jgi:tripartite-type tricarboxylate transporter receptor subunit TctC